MRHLLVLACSLLILFTISCRDTPDATAPAEDQPRMAIAEMHPTEGNQARGTVTFEEVSGGIRVVAHIEGLPPGKRGFHIHETGDCTAPDATSAGPHFDPQGHRHGAPGDDEHHAGDFGNIEVDSEGVGHFEMTADFIAFEGPASIIGRAVIVHAEEDDLTSQPTGEAGARLACGVIRMR
jgi:superoxide dismutase, Cu-Zn family